jgi:hypothetical protein
MDGADVFAQESCGAATGAGVVSTIEAPSDAATCVADICAGLWEFFTAASNSVNADVIDASASATRVSSCSPVSARTVIKLPAADLTVILMGASVEDTIFSLLSEWIG